MVSEVGDLVVTHLPPTRHFPRAALFWRLSSPQIDCLGAEFNFHLSHRCELVAHAEAPVGSADL